MNTTKISIALAVTFASALTAAGCAGSADSVPKASASSVSETAPSAEPRYGSPSENGELKSEDPDSNQVTAFESVIEYATDYEKIVASLFENSPMESRDYVVRHEGVPFIAELEVVSQRPLAPRLGAKADQPTQPQDSPQKIAEASEVVNTYFTAVMNAMETGDSSQLGKIALDSCDLCTDTKATLKEATDPKTYEKAQVYYSGLVFPSSPIEFVRTDGIFYHFKSSAVERTFYSNIKLEPWIVRGDDAGNFVMDIVVARSSEGWIMAFYGVTSVE